VLPYVRDATELARNVEAFGQLVSSGISAEDLEG
jgi:hypothetical protein